MPISLKKIHYFASQKLQAAFRPVPTTDSILHVCDFLTWPDHAIAFTPTPDKIERMRKSYNAIESLFLAKGLKLERINTEALPGKPLRIRTRGTVPEPHDRIQDQLKPLVTNLASTFESIVRPVLGNNYIDIDILPFTSGGVMHQHPDKVTLATFGLGQGEQTTEYPGLWGNQRSSPNTVLFFGSDFWHCSPDSDRPVIVAYI